MITKPSSCIAEQRGPKAKSQKNADDAEQKGNVPAAYVHLVFRLVTFFAIADERFAQSTALNQTVRSFHRVLTCANALGGRKLHL